MPKDPRLTEAEIAKVEAEVEVAKAEARKANAEAAQAEGTFDEIARMNRIAEIRLAKTEEEEASRLASDDNHRVYRFLGGVGAGSVKDAASTLTRWSRVDPECDITILIDSPGGGIIEGLHLYDTILDIRERGHKITTVTYGMAASMGGILLQAGTERVAGRNASILIHEASFGAAGSFGQVEDQVEFVKKLQERLLGILAERSNLSAVQIKNRWKRKNWWLDADEALKFGFVDRIA